MNPLCWTLSFWREYCSELRTSHTYMRSLLPFFSTGWNRMPRTADGMNAKGRQQSYLLLTTRLREGQAKVPTPSVCFCRDVSVLCVDEHQPLTTTTKQNTCRYHPHAHTNYMQGHTHPHKNMHAHAVKFSTSHAAHQHDWVIFRKITELAMFIFFSPKWRIFCWRKSPSKRKEEWGLGGLLYEVHLRDRWWEC